MTFRIWSPEITTREMRASVYRNDITMLGNGGYVVTFNEETAQRTTGFQMYDGHGRVVGGPLYLDHVTAGYNHREASVQTIGRDGDFLVTWSENTGSASAAVYAQRYQFNGTKVGDRTQVSSNANYNDATVMAQGDADGWAIAYLNGTNTEVKRYNQDGSLKNSITLSQLVAPIGLDMAYIGNDTHVVTYRENNKLLFKVAFGKVLNAQGEIAGLTDLVYRTDVVALKRPDGSPDGTFVVVAETNGKIVTQHFNWNGAELGAPITFTSTIDDGTSVASVTALQHGGFAIAYIAPNGTDKGDVWVETVTAAGVRTGPLLVNTAGTADDGTSRQNTPTIYEMADGRLAISWNDRTVGYAKIKTAIVDARTAAVTVTGTSHDDIYVGSDYAGDILNGLVGNDQLIGGLGGDRLDGGAGIDLASFQYASAGVVASLATKTGTGGEAAGDTYEGIENFLGSTSGDSLTGDAGSNTIWGNAGNDVLSGGAGYDVLSGDSGNDIYYVSDADLIIEAGGNGSDTLYADVSFVLAADAEVETLIATGASAIALTGSNSANTIFGNAAANVLDGRTGGDSLFGQEGSDALYGREGDDVLDGGTGADVMDGGTGSDTFYVDSTSDTVVEAAGQGTDTVIASVSFALGSSNEIENLTAAGGSSNLSLTGNGIANDITGNAGANKLYGGAGNDKLRGGTGKDFFVFNTKANKNSNVDKILDYDVREDSVWLDNKYFKLGAGKESKPKKFSADKFVIGTSAQDLEDRIVYDKKSGALYYDADGSGGAKQVKIATFSKKLKMTFADFFVI